MAKREKNSPHSEDMTARVALRKMFGLDPKIVPDSRGLLKMCGMMNTGGKETFDGVDLLRQTREKD